MLHPDPHPSSLTRRRLLGLLTGGAAAALLLPSARAQTAPSTRNDLGGILEPIRADHELPAMAAAVVIDGATVATGAVGSRRYGGSVPVTVGDQFHLGSCTKAMTATLCGMLVEDGKLTWNTTLAQVFPDIPMQPKYRDVTVDHLLAHRSGLSAESWPHGKTVADLHALPGLPPAQREAYLRLILAEAPIAEPGALYVYSNRNFAVLGAMVDRLSGMGWEEFLRQKLFEPLGMTSAGFGAMGTPGQVDQPWQYKMTGLNRKEIPPGRLSDNPPAIAPAATVHCSVGDWAKFISLHLQGERGVCPLLLPGTIQRLHTPLFGGNYVAGWIRLQRTWGGGNVLTHTGSNTQNLAVVWIAPQKDIAFLVMTNQGGDVADQAADRIVHDLIHAFLRG